jgi:arabinan endo-1,5-alpha-L-arabinosidase
VGKGKDSERTFGVWEWPKGDKRLKFQQSGGGKWFDIDSTRTIEAGVWTHIAATMKGNRGALYVNGEKDGEKDREAVPSTGTDIPLTFGMAPGLHSALKGALDDIRLYRRALGDDEIRTLYESSR